MTAPNEDVQTEVRAAAEALNERLSAWRRELHRYPEVGLHLPRTQAIVVDALRRLGLDVQTGTGHSAVIARLVGPLPGATVLLRADMDALEITEREGDDFASENPGVMHACGHDAHTAMLLGAAQVLAARRESLAGTVVFAFQAGEEGHGGAQRMIDEGLLDGVDEAYAVHIAPPLPVGILASRAGTLMASSTPFDVRFRGEGGHGADVGRGGVVDAVTRVAASLGRAAVALAKRHDTAYASIGVLRAGDAANVQPTGAVLGGTLRAYSDRARAHAMRQIERSVDAVAVTTDVTIELHWSGPDAPVMVNDKDAYRRARRAGAVVVGAGAMLEVASPIGASEDFALIAQRVPAALVFVGAGGAGAGQVHAPSLRIDESCLAVGTAFYAELALQSSAAESRGRHDVLDGRAKRAERAVPALSFRPQGLAGEKVPSTHAADGRDERGGEHGDECCGDEQGAVAE